MKEANAPFNFSELFPYHELFDEIPLLEPYQTRGDDTLSFRKYQAKSSNVHVILLHGSSAHSAYLHPFAKHLRGYTEEPPKVTILR